MERPAVNIKFKSQPPRGLGVPVLLLVVAERLWILARHGVSGIAPATHPSQRDGGNLALAFAPFPRPFRTNSNYAPNQTLACLANIQRRFATRSL